LQVQRWISLIGTGGTIVSADDGSGRLAPALPLDHMVSTIENIDAKVVLRPLMTLASRDMGPASMFTLARAVREEAENGASAVVITHGTDTLEETAYAMSLLVPPQITVILTGAMRPADSPGSDGPQNLRDALVAAAEPKLTGHGPCVVMGGEIHAGHRVRKVHPSRLDAFASPGEGPLGTISDGRVATLKEPDSFNHYLPHAASPEGRVALVWSVGDDDGFVLERIADGVDGLVVAALGSGRVSGRQATPLKELAKRCPVVLASRCGSGELLAPVYGGPGSESDLLAAGLVPAGRLDPVKARLRLLFGMSAGIGVQRLFPVS
jgi:L-asparaginase